MHSALPPSSGSQLANRDAHGHSTQKTWEDLMAIGGAHSGQRQRESERAVLLQSLLEKRSEPELRFRSGVARALVCH